MDRPLDPAVIRRVSIRRWLAVAGVVAAVLGIGWIARALLQPSVRAADIRTAVVERGPVEAATLCSGTVVPALEQVIPCPFTTRVLAVVVQPGAEVERGDPLLELDGTDARLAVGRLEDQAALVANRRRELGIALDRKLADLAGKIEIQRERLAFLSTQTAQQQALRDLGLTASHELRKAELDEHIAAIELRQLEESLDTERESTEAQRAGLEIEASLLERDLEEQRHRLLQATVRAGRHGVVTSLEAHDGASVRDGDELARLADLSRFRVEATLSDLHAGRIAVGMAVRVEVGDAVLDGRVASIPPTMADGVMTLVVELDQPDHAALKPNRRADVYVITEARQQALRVVRGPYLKGTGLQRVFVLGDDGWARRTEVQLGVAGIDSYEVVAGLAAGDSVIVSDLGDRLHLERLRVR